MKTKTTAAVAGPHSITPAACEGAAFTGGAAMTIPVRSSDAGVTK